MKSIYSVPLEDVRLYVLCEKANINFDDAMKVKIRQPKLREEDIVGIVLHSQNKPNILVGEKGYNVEVLDGSDVFNTETFLNRETLQDMCKRKNISYKMAQTYKKKNPELSDADIVRAFLSLKDFEKLCLDIGIEPFAITYYASDNYLSRLESIKYFFDRGPVDIKQMCREALAPYNEILKIKTENPSINDNMAVFLAKKQDLKLGSIEDRCTRAGLNYKSFLKYRKKFEGTDLSTSELIEQYKQYKNRKSFTQKCNEAGISYAMARSIKTRNKDLTDEEIIALCLERQSVLKEETFVDLCKKAGIDPVRAQNYKDRNGLTIPEVIQYYNPYCYYNITGNFVIVPLPKE